MLQVTKNGIRKVYFKDDNWYYVDSLQVVEEKFQQGYQTSALKRSSTSKVAIEQTKESKEWFEKMRLKYNS